MTKRKSEDAVAYNTRSKKPRLVQALTHQKKLPWVSATKTYNFMTNDPLVDWLTLIGHKNRSRSSSFDGDKQTFTEYIMQKGIDFEDRVIKYINTNIHPVVTVSKFYSLQGVKDTIKYLKMGVPILHSAPLCHHPSRTYGVADLIVRSDILLDLAPNTIIDKNILKNGCAFSNNYHYVVIDIKFSSLKLNSKGKCLLNNASMPAYKCQVWIYNRALAHIQKYTPQYAYILGRRWDYRSKNVQYKNESCFDRLGVVDINDYDAHIIAKGQQAIKWYRDVRKNGLAWSVEPPTRDELYPNMCKDNTKWNATKHKIAKDLGEITQVWMCGVKNRKQAFLKGIKSWKHPLASSKAFGVNGNRGLIIDKMLHINKQSSIKILPEKVSENSMKWRNVENEVFVDFETFGDIFMEGDTDVNVQKRDNIIFQIGVGYNHENKWKYKYFICEQPTKSEEFRIMDEFVNFLSNRGNPKIWYWHAEDNFWKTSCKFQFAREDISPYQKSKIINWDLSSSWLDMRKLFVKEQIVINGCFSFGLKNIGKALKKWKLINTPMESDCSNGQKAMVQAWRCYQKFEKPCESGIMKDVVKYNEYDCRLLHDILYYLRNNH